MLCVNRHFVYNMSNNNNRRESQNNYPQNRQPRYPPRQRPDQGLPHPHYPPPFAGNPHYPPSYYPPPYYPPYKEDGMRHPYNQPPMPNPYYCGQYPPYPMPYPNYQQPFPYPPPQHTQNQAPSLPERKTYEERVDQRPERQERPERVEQKQERSERPERQERPERNERNERHYEQKERVQEPKRSKPYESRNDRYDSRNERTQRPYESREARTVSPRIERRNEQSEKKREDRDESDCQSREEYQSQSDSESQEVVYRRKAIVKRKDPVLDNKEEIRKWIEARRRNYPRQSQRPEEAQGKVEQSEMSILEKKIRKKILLINADPKSMMKKLKDIDILRRFILYSRKPRRNTPLPPRRFDRQQHEEVVQSQPSLPLVEEEEVKVQVQVQVEPIMAKSEAILPEEEGEEAVEQPIKNEKEVVRVQQPREYWRREELSVDVIIKHLQMKQAEDTKTLESLMDYKSNSFHYRYQHQTLETNLLLENIFSETSYILQAIRYIVKNDFFDQPAPQ